MKDGGPAFPGGDGVHAGNPQYYTPGMSLRDYFAAQAMQAMVSSCRDVERDQGPSMRKDGSLIDFVRPSLIDDFDVAEDVAKLVASCSYIIADAMLAAREGGAS